MSRTEGISKIRLQVSQPDVYITFSPVAEPFTRFRVLGARKSLKSSDVNRFLHVQTKVSTHLNNVISSKEGFAMVVI